MVRTGSSTYLQYGKEGSFSGGATATRVFGLQQKFTGITWKNNQIPLTQLNNIEVASFAYGKNEGSGSVEFVMSNPWIFDIMLDGVDKTGTTNDYSYLWSSDKSALTADNTDINTPNSVHIEYGFDAETQSVTRNMKGVLVNSFNLKSTINETVKCSTELLWGLEDAIDTSYTAGTVTDGVEFPYTFAHAELLSPTSGSTVAQIQDFDITFSTNSELLYTLNSPNAAGGFRKIFEMTGKFKAAMVDKSELQKVIDRTESATLKVTLTNGLSTTNEKSITLAFTGVGVSEHTTDTSPGEPVFENLSFQMRSVNVTANNSVNKTVTSEFMTD